MRFFLTWLLTLAGGMTWLARRTGLNRVTLYRLLSGKGNPTLASLSSILQSLGLEIGCHPTASGA